MRKHLTHIAVALAVTFLLGAAASPLSAAAAAPELPAAVAELDAENAAEAAAESRLSQSYLDMTIEYNDPHPVRQLYLSSAADGDMVYQWYSTNPAVAAVDRNGIVTAQKPGRAVIVADTYTKTLRCEVEVTSNVGKVTLNVDELLLESIGGAAPLKATVAVENGSAVSITWLTADPQVTAVGDGKTVITAVTPDGHSASCPVYCGTQVAVRQQIKANETKLALGILGGFAVLAGVLALATSGG